MNYKISKQAASAAIALLDDIAGKVAVYDDAINLTIGSPAVETFPVSTLQKYAATAYAGDPGDVLGYPPEPGKDSLIEQIKHWLFNRGVDITDRRLFVIPGSGPGMDVMAHAFCDKDDVILTEEFSYPGILSAARCVEASIVSVKNDIDGINLEDLEHQASQHHPKFLYVIPTFSNPCGSTLSHEKRKAIYKLAQKYDFMIYEDEPYSQLRFAGTDIPPFINMDPDGRVVHAETFSKTLAPGLRCGFLLFSSALENPLVYSLGNQGGPSGPVQEMIAQYMAQEDFTTHIKKTAEFYHEKCTATLAALDKYLPKECIRTNPEGGMFVWVTCPDCVDTLKLSFDLIERKHVGIIPSAAFAPNPAEPGHGFRLSFSRATAEQLDVGIAAISQLIKEQL